MPLGHWVHAVLAGADENVPAGHALHGTASATDAEKVPAGHSVHCTVPSAEAYVPCEHARQVVRPVEDV